MFFFRASLKYFVAFILFIALRTDINLFIVCIFFPFHFTERDAINAVRKRANLAAGII